jgi:hypothetical protein
LGLSKPSVFEAKNNITKYSDAKFRRDALLGIGVEFSCLVNEIVDDSIHVVIIALERCAGEVIAEMLDIAENYDPDEAQLELMLHGIKYFLI